MAAVLEPWNRLAEKNALVGFVDTLLRGTGQVMFQNNPVTGVLFLAGIFYNSRFLGGLGVLGLVSSTVTAVALGSRRSLEHTAAFIGSPRVHSDGAQGR
jgi:urea transporter